MFHIIHNSLHSYQIPHYVVVLDPSSTLCPILGTKRTIGLCGNRVLVGTLVSKGVEIWRNWTNLHDLLSSENIIMIESRRVRWSEDVARREELKIVCTTLVGKTKQKRTLGRRRYRLEDLMFFWLCIMNWLYINYQLDALIIIYS